MSPACFGLRAMAMRAAPAVTISLLIAGILAACTPPPPSPSSAAASGGTLKQVHDPGHVTGTITGPCHAAGRLPDPRCTPGSTDPAVTQASIRSTICRAGYTAAVRPPSSETAAFKHAAYLAYGLARDATAELDHLVPLELGGSNDAADLWPEAGRIPNPKDRTENDLRAAVCTGRVRLVAAQQAIARNWTTAEHTLGLAAAAPPGLFATQVRTTR